MNIKRVLVVGSGGREYSLIRKLRKTREDLEIICAPGNGGISEIAECVSVSATDVEGMVKLAKEKRIDFCVVTPDDPLALGMVDAMEAAGIPSFGPTAAAARIESSKIFAKELMEKADIPTAKFKFFTNADDAIDFVSIMGFPIVIKADGLAKGKGVVVAKDMEEAYGAINSMLNDKVFGEAGSRIIIEEFLEGVEVSVMSFCDGIDFVPMVSAQDHKRVFDGGLGPNTGGMGAFAPSRHYTDEIANEVNERVFAPALKAMAELGCPFKGVLYAGLILTNKGLYVLEFNARFGDPETQVVLPLLEGDLLEIMVACRNSTLKQQKISFSKDACAVVIMVSAGYPGKPQLGDEISGLENVTDPNAWIIHAGTVKRDGIFYTSGGRVLGVCARGKDLDSTIEKVYDNVRKIGFRGMHFRRDIGRA